jgi:hypothetical protein
MGITKQMLYEQKLAMKNIFYFANSAWIIHPTRGKVQFDLYKFQKAVLYNFLKHRFNIVLKPRQMGLTELIALFSLWMAMYTPHYNIQIISLKERVAKKLLRRIKHIYDNLPLHLRIPITNGVKGRGTATELIFINNSVITSIPTTEDAGRSEAVSLLIIDEAAIIKNADTIWAAAFPTLSTGGRAIINSTPLGVGNWYHQTWVDGLSGSNGFNNIKLDWRMHPDRQDDWYQLMRNALGPKRTAQEIDGDFLSSGDTVFDLVDIKDIEEFITDNPPIERRMDGRLLIFKKPTEGTKYYLGADVATGRAKDYSTFTILDAHGKEMAAFKGRVPTNRFAHIIANIGREYNNALAGVEANDVGEAVVMVLQEISYPSIYYTRRFVKVKGESKPKEEKVPGWFTTSKTRPVIINMLEEDVREVNLEIKNPYFVHEAYTFIYDEANRPIAMNKGDYIGNGDETYTDDTIICTAIANYIRKGKFNVMTTAA